MAHAARPPAAVFARRFRFLDVSLWKNTSFFTAAFPFISSPAFDYSSRVQVPSQVTAEPESQAPSHRHQQSGECIFCILKSCSHILHIAAYYIAYFAYCRQLTTNTSKPAYWCIFICIFICIFCILNCIAYCAYCAYNITYFAY